MTPPTSPTGPPASFSGNSRPDAAGLPRWTTPLFVIRYCGIASYGNPTTPQSGILGLQCRHHCRTTKVAQRSDSTAGPPLRPARTQRKPHAWVEDGLVVPGHVARSSGTKGWGQICGLKRICRWHAIPCPFDCLGAPPGAFDAADDLRTWGRRTPPPCIQAITSRVVNADSLC